MTRKPIQIAAIPETDERAEKLFALCGDGTIWVLKAVFKLEPAWRRVPDIANEKPIGRTVHLRGQRAPSLPAD